MSRKVHKNNEKTNFWHYFRKNKFAERSIYILFVPTQMILSKIIITFGVSVSVLLSTCNPKQRFKCNETIGKHLRALLLLSQPRSMSQHLQEPLFSSIATLQFILIFNFW